MQSNHNDDIEVMRIASEIRRYLGNHPQGVDTIDGITKWWLPQQRIEESSLLVQQALDYLVSESRIKRTTNLDGKYLYFDSTPVHGEQKH
ncbi:hypothetical protein [Neptunomonas japonica]|uniref:hypothetical protein n=1 Tax=Neptunomonas japonica TaxID=417574 RepID=UPI00041F7D1C|nr:hypothetical protein [Neptunomonas japonica]